MRETGAAAEWGQTSRPLAPSRPRDRRLLRKCFRNAPDTGESPRQVITRLVSNCVPTPWRPVSGQPAAARRPHPRTSVQLARHLRSAPQLESGPTQGGHRCLRIWTPGPLPAALSAVRARWTAEFLPTTPVTLPHYEAGGPRLPPPPASPPGIRARWTAALYT